MYIPAVAQCSLADVRWPRSSENCPGCVILLWDLDGRWSTPVLHPPPKAHCSPTPHVEGGVVRTEIWVHKRVTTLCGMIVMHIVTMPMHTLYICIHIICIIILYTNKCYIWCVRFDTLQRVTLSGDSKSTKVGVKSILSQLKRAAASALGYTQHVSRALGHNSHDPL